MKYDGTLDIATGLSAGSKSWKNTKFEWSGLVQRLSEEHKTTETFKEYMAAAKDEQGKIKDIGGYVGGYLRGGRRKPENVLHRQVLTLDIDFAHIDFWEDFCLQFSNAAVLHSTHKHHESSPRYRLIMPLSRECSPDEYVATARKIAGILDIELFDSTTFETNRLMFWPSNPKDVDYYFRFQDGPFIDVEEILDTYVDWTDSSAWPISQRQSQRLKNTFEKQEDPENKKGIVGAFCRTYAITEAIDTFLTDVYTTGSEGRYTYIKGSTPNGLIIYDDKFSYSHHGTDPVSMKTCNAFDLVRIHKFGHLDDSSESGSKSKSYQAMEEFARKDKEVKKIIASENLVDAKYEFVDDTEPESDSSEWMVGLELDARNKYISSAANISLIFANDIRLRGLFKENAFDNKRYIFGNMPWRKITKPEPIKNVDYSGIRNYMECLYGINGSMKIDDALALEFEKNSFNPVKDYLRGLVWDGVSRVDEVLIKYFKAADNIYTREAMRLMMVGAVARIMKPGVKFELVLILVSPTQGTGKSSFFRALGGEWFSDSFKLKNTNQDFEQLQGAWIIEMGELAGLKKAEVEDVKHYISKEDDTFRPAYGRVPETFLRSNVFVGSTNIHGFLNDTSGGRRFMPIDIANVKIRYNAALLSFIKDKELINQLWAEAVEMYNSGMVLDLSNEAEKIASQEQRKHTDADERTGIIENYLETPIPEKWESMDIFERRKYLSDPLVKRSGLERDAVCVAEIWCECLGKEKEDMDRYKTRDINEILRGLTNWEQINSTKNFSIYGKQKYYARKLD